MGEMTLSWNERERLFFGLEIYLRKKDQLKFGHFLDLMIIITKK